MTSGLPAPPPLTRTVLAKDERARPAASMRSAISDKRDFLSPGQRHGNPVQKGLSSRASPVSSTSIDSAHTVVTLSRARLGEPPGRLRRQGRPEKGEGRAFQGSLIRNAAPWGRTEGHGPGDLEGSERRPGSLRRCHRCPLLTRGTLGAPCPHSRAVPAHSCGSVRSVSDTGRQRSLLLDGNQAARGPWGRQVGSLHPESACTPSRGGRASAAPWLLGHALPQGAEDQALHEPPGGEGTGVRWAGLPGPALVTRQSRHVAEREEKLNASGFASHRLLRISSQSYFLSRSQ